MGKELSMMMEKESRDTYNAVPMVDASKEKKTPRRPCRTLGKCLIVGAGIFGLVVLLGLEVPCHHRSDTMMRGHHRRHHRDHRHHHPHDGEEWHPPAFGAQFDGSYGMHDGPKGRNEEFWDHKGSHHGHHGDHGDHGIHGPHHHHFKGGLRHGESSSSSSSSSESSSSSSELKIDSFSEDSLSSKGKLEIMESPSWEDEEEGEGFWVDEEEEDSWEDEEKDTWEDKDESESLFDESAESWEEEDLAEVVDENTIVEEERLEVNSSD